MLMEEHGKKRGRLWGQTEGAKELGNGDSDKHFEVREEDWSGERMWKEEYSLRSVVKEEEC